ncbi:hypothetical protein [Turicibacter sanguinis]|uniref:hypothetical protein n=1 Tax=Turicibacter sanguinis TaxID=154288 RepID=UPI0021D4AE7D|nr:hypothetical protein [Turicibacter sanguinis]MCU7195933.1 hypothetical protein [Turicibacter sanguinis]
MLQMTEELKHPFDEAIKDDHRKLAYRIKIDNQVVLLNQLMSKMTITTDGGFEEYHVGYALTSALDFSTKKELKLTPSSYVDIEVGLEVERGEEYEITYLPFQRFYLYDSEMNGMERRVKCYDYMYKLASKGYFPSAKHQTTVAVCQDMSQQLGIEFKGVQNVSIDAEELEGRTYKETLGYLASAMGCNVRIARDNKIEFFGITTTNLTLFPREYKTPTTNESTYQITCLEVHYGEKKTGENGEVLDEGYYRVGEYSTKARLLMLSNPLLKNQREVALRILNKIKELSYPRFETSISLADYRLEVGDMVSFQMEESKVTVPLLYTQYTLVYDNVILSLKSPTKSQEKKEYSFQGTLTQKVNAVYTDLIQVKTLVAEKVSVEQLEAEFAKIEKLYVKEAEIDQLVAGSIAVQDLQANIANLNVLVAGKADISELNAAVANINILNADLADIKHLVSGHLSAENMQVGGITFDRIQGNTVVIVDAMIQSVNAAKIQAGQLDTTLVHVASSSGNLMIQDNTIQIRDANRLRVQIGKDASNDYSMSVWDSSGKLMFDARGLKADAIKDSIIRNDMISTNANIDGSKLNISSVVSEINEGSTTLKASKVQFDGIAQTLEVAFNLLKTQADGTKSQTESNTTAINVAQGKINALIQDTTITKDGQTVKLKDEYSKLEQTVGSLSSTIGKQQTTIDDHTGKMTAFNSEMVSLKQNLNGLSASVSTAETTIQSHAQQLAQKADLTTVNEKIDGIQIGVRNLLLNSGVEWNNNDYLIAWYKPSELLTKGETYTVTLCVTPAKGVTHYALYLSRGYALQCKLAVSGTNKQIISATFRANYHSDRIPTSPDDTWARIDLYRFPHDGTVTSNSVVHWIKIEKGNKATGWTEAPEDIQSSIDTKANSSDVYVKTEVYTKAQTDAAIKIAKDEINLGVSSTYETKTNVETKVNGAITTASNDATSKAHKALISAKGYTDLQMTTVNQTITDKVAEIKLTTDSITQRVSTTESNLTNMTNKLNNLQIGVRNLVENSKIAQTSNAYGFGTRAIISGLKNNTTYTFTVNGRVNPEGNTEGKYLRCYIYEKTWKYGSWNLAITETSDTTKSLTFTTGSNLEGQTIEVNFYYYPKDGDRTGSATVNWCTLVEGNKGTIDWIEAPEDVQETIISTKTEVKEYTDSQINIAKNVITQSVASTYETKTDATSKINGVNSSISALQQRVSNAESKITDTAITNLVKQNFYTKEETETQITSKGYATSSEVQQTSTSLIAKFSASGGYNAIRNSGFLHAFTFWGTQTHNSPTGGSIGTIGPTADWGFPNTRLNTAQIRLSNQSNVEYGLKCSVDTTIGKVYTIRFRYAAHRVNQVNVIVRNGGGGWHTNKYIDAPYTYSGGKGSEASWGIFTHTFRANNTSHVLNFVITNAANDGFFWVAEPMVFEGDIDAPYSPHPSEVYWGQTLIDQNGIRVNASNVGTYTEMHAGGFFVKKNDGNLLFEATNKIALYDGKGISCISIVNDPSANYGNARIDLRGGINFIHNPGQDVGINQILLGNDDRSDKYGFHNMSIRCWNSFGFQDNYGYTNMFADVRRGRWIMKGTLYQNTQTPPATFSMNFDGEDEIYNSGYERSQAIDSVMNLKTGVYVDNDGECCSAIYGGYSELITTEYQDEYGEITTHLNHEALNASLVVTCQEQQKLIKSLQKELNEIKEYLNVA